MRFSICLLLSFHLVESYKILVYNSKFGHSHSTFLGQITDILADTGHNVVSSDAFGMFSMEMHGNGMEMFCFFPDLASSYHKSISCRWNWEIVEDSCPTRSPYHGIVSEPLITYRTDILSGTINNSKWTSSTWTCSVLLFPSLWVRLI